MLVSDYRSLDKSISTLQMEMAASRSSQEMASVGNTLFGASSSSGGEGLQRQRAFVVIGINTAFSSRKRRDSIRETWMPQGFFFFF